MNEEAPLHHSIYAANLVRLVGRWGFDVATVLEGTGIAPADIAEPDRLIEDTAMGALARRAMKLTREPGLGFHLGLEANIAAHGAVGFAALTSATLGQALGVTERFFALRAGHLELSHYVDGDRACLEITERVPLEDLEPFLMESLFVAFGKMGRQLLGAQLRGDIEVRYPEPPYFRGFAHLWPGPARFDRPVNRLSFSASLLETPLSMADDFASREAIARCEAELSKLGETSSFLASVRKQIHQKRRGFLSLTELAEARGVSPRTLKRSLTAHGTSFQALLDELRRDHATRLLEGSERPVTEIARELGYGEAVSFRRAFRRWMGMSPAEWREHARRTS